MTHEELNEEFIRVKRIIDSFVIEEPKLFSRKSFSIGNFEVEQDCKLLHVILESPSAVDELVEKFQDNVKEESNFKIIPTRGENELVVHYIR